LGAFLGLTLLVAVSVRLAERDDTRRPDRIALALAWAMPAVSAVGLVALGAYPGRLAIAVVLAVFVGLLLIRFRGGRRRGSHLMPLAIGWLPALVLVSGLSLVRPSWLLAVAGAGLGLLAVIALVSAWRDRGASSDRTLVALWWLAPLGLAAVASLWRPMYIGRYFLPVLPAWMLMAAAGLDALRWRPLQAGAALVVAVASVASLQAMYDRPVDDFRAAAAYLKGGFEANDLLVTAPATGLVSYPLAFYFGSAPPELVLPPAPGDALAAVGAAKAQGRRIWLVVSGSVPDEEVARLERTVDTSLDRRERHEFGSLRVERWDPAALGSP
jgi:hypothetical protein